MDISYCKSVINTLAHHTLILIVSVYIEKGPSQ